jgi:hypothetical protein
MLKKTERDAIGDLLLLAGAPDDTRAELEIAIGIARAGYGLELRRRKQSPPTELLERLEKSIRTTLALLGEAEEYADFGAGFLLHPPGTGVVDAANIWERNVSVSKRPWTATRGVPKIGPDGIVVGINARNLLLSLSAQIRREHPKKKRGAPRERDIAAVVFYALDFFLRHSDCNPSKDEANPFRLFAERFYEVTTGRQPPSLEHHIKEALAENRARPARETNPRK